MLNAALVLEGGALRSIYTAGVLDVLIENDIDFPYIIASSAGAQTAANYIGKHIGRTARINLLHSTDPKYFGLRQYVKSRGNIFNFDYLYHSPVNDLYPYNMDIFNDFKRKFIITATDCKTGQPIYFQKSNYDDMTRALTASCSMPLLSKIVELDGFYCLDGGISVPIAFKKALEDGFEKVIIVLTRDLTFRKKEDSSIMKLAFKFAYRKYPRLVKRLLEIPSRYNEIIEEIASLERMGKLFVVRPSSPLNISRIEKDARKLLSGYLQGRDDMKANMTKMLNYVGVQS